MNKEEFIKKLRKRLSVLEDKEIEDIVSEYVGYIEEKEAIGLTEEEAVKELGDFEEIMSDLLAAYKVKNTAEEEGTVNKIINKISNMIDNFMDSLDNKSAKDIIKVLIEVIIVLLLIGLLKFPFAMIRDLGNDIFYEIPRPIGNLLGTIWWIIIETSYILVSIIFFFKMFEKRYFKNVSTKIVDDIEEEEETKKCKNKESKKGSKSEKITEEVIVRKSSFVDTLTNVCIAFLKFFAVIFVIATIFYQIGISVALVFMIYIICKGVTYIGILILMIALFMGGAFILKLLINFIFNKKIKAYQIFIELITCIIVLAVGLTLSAIEISTTEVVYDSSNIPTKTTSKTYPITKDNMLIHLYDEILVDNTLEDEIKIELTYPEINNLKLDVDLNRCGREDYCIYSDVSYFRWNKESLDFLIKYLKDKKIYVQDFQVKKTIYVNESDLKKIKGGKYYDMDNYEYVRTFEVLNIIDNNEEYVSLTLKSLNSDETATVEVSKSIKPNFEIGKIYNFIFTYSENRFPEKISHIFNLGTLVNVEETIIGEE